MGSTRVHILLIAGWLHLFEDDLNGTIPTELGLLSNLEILGLAKSHLTGTIPTEVGLLSNLEWLGLDSNQLTGTVPTGLASLPLVSKLQSLFFQCSFFTMGSHVYTSSSLQRACFSMAMN